MPEETFRSGITFDARESARKGRLSAYFLEATEEQRRQVRAAIHEIAQPIVFQNMTRKLEIRRGHRRCAVAVRCLDDECLDRFHDDMDSVIDDIVRNARVSIENLDGWISKRLRAATINGYRRRRGERGALQRPRVPRWLATRLDDVPRLVALAAEVLEFVGNDVDAGTGVWPTERWAERRAQEGVGFETTVRAVVRDVEDVLAAMRAKPEWYASYVERPLSRKPHLAVPVAELPVRAVEALAAERDDRLTELAGLALDAVTAGLRRGEDPRTVVARAISGFGRALGASHRYDGPWAASTLDDLVFARLADEAVVEQITSCALEACG